MNDPLDKDALKIDAAAEVERIAAKLREQVLVQLKRRGAVVGISGGVDSSVVAAICVRAFGTGRVLGLLLPEQHSSHEALALGRQLAEHLGMEFLVENVGPALGSLGCYDRQADAIRQVVPGFAREWKFKLVLASAPDGAGLNVSKLVVQDPAGAVSTVRLPAHSYRQLVAATNYKQRVRKSVEYYHADCRNYAVVGTPNRLEFDQGFFVKQGDGCADVKPIAHLYKSQVYQLAEHLGIPGAIVAREPTTDTFSMPQTQEEFYFALPYPLMDMCLYAVNHGYTAQAVASAVGLASSRVERIFRDIDAKRRATRYLHLPALLAASITEV